MLPGFLHRLLAEVRLLVEKPKYRDVLASKNFRIHSPPAKPNCSAWLGGQTLPFSSAHTSICCVTMLDAFGPFCSLSSCVQTLPCLPGAIFGALQDILGSRSVSRDYYNQTGRIPDWCCLSSPPPESLYEAGKTPPPLMKRAFSTEK